MALGSREGAWVVRPSANGHLHGQGVDRRGKPPALPLYRKHRDQGRRNGSRGQTLARQARRHRTPPDSIARLAVQAGKSRVIQIEEALESCVWPEPGGATALVRDRNDIDSIGIDLLLEGIRRRWGYDFTHYSYASIRRRLDHARREAGFKRFTELLDRLLYDEAFFDRFLKHMSIPVTEMFRDPAFYRVVREKVVPI